MIRPGAPGSRAYKPFGGGPHKGGPAYQGGGGKPPKKDCCPMVAAIRSVKRGKFRLARRYAAMSVRLIGGWA